MPIDLTKQQVIDLRKKVNFVAQSLGLEGRKAKVKLVLDISYSMQDNFRSGVVQRVISKLLPIALEFDNDGEIEVILFGDRGYVIGNVNINNLEDFVKTQILTKHSIEEGTDYAAALRLLLPRDNSPVAAAKGLWGRLTGTPAQAPAIPAPTDEPDFVIFITDGETGNQTEIQNLMIELSKYPVFIQYVGIGRSRFGFLETLDTMEGRLIDNAGFMKIEDIDNETPMNLYKGLLNEFPAYIKLAQGVNLVKK
jgi:hypothetical protein